ncbi:MAG: hypothetical protein GKR98_06155 [Boseongicola sp.]|nr:MAG: hypothetical protein GKR98_06155 [Boseongicola sp.]
MAERLVECSTHGQTRPAFVCQHLLATLRDKKERGVNWLWDEEKQVNAWCNDCEDFLQSHGEEWNDETEAFAKITLICEGCFNRLKDTNPTRDLN